MEEARPIVTRFVAHYNGVRLHSAIGYGTPSDFLASKAEVIWAERDKRLEAARARRAELRRAARSEPAA